MDWQQHFPPYSRKDYSLDLLFGLSMVFHQVPASDSLVIGDPDHHESMVPFLKLMDWVWNPLLVKV